MTMILLCFGPLALGMGNAADTAPPSAPTVLKVDPPFWWTGHTINPVRLLIRGANLKGAKVFSSRSDLRLDDVRVNDDGTYLFTSLRVNSAAAPSEAGLRLETDGGTVAIPFRLEPPLTPDKFAGARGIDQDDVIYLIMPDRFADGDPANNAPASSPSAAIGRDRPRGFHGGDLRGIIDHLPYFQELGITALWLTPWYDNDNGLYECDKPWCPYTYYHGYHPVNHYAVEDHFGTLDTLRELVSKAHARGIKVIQDQVSNHVGLRHPWVSAPPLPNWFHGTPARHLRNPFLSELISSPHSALVDRARCLDGWFSEDSPDLNQDEPEVARYLIQNALWWVGVTGIDGIREDTAQFLPRTFLRDLTAALHRQHPRITVIGEVLDLDPVHVSFFLGGKPGWDGIDTGLDSVFDAPGWFMGVQGFIGKTPMTELRKLLRADLLYPDASRLITMTSNHDLRRFPSWPGANLDRTRLQIAWTLSLRGIPQLYYGDEIGLPGDDDPDNRRDFPGGFSGDPRSAFTSPGRTVDQERIWTWTRDWIALRRAHSSLRRGTFVDLDAGPEHYVFARRHANETIVVAFNRAEKPLTASFSVAAIEGRGGMSMVCLTGGSERIQVRGERISIELPAYSAKAFELRP
jgi:glycosidase